MQIADRVDTVRSAVSSLHRPAGFSNFLTALAACSDLQSLVTISLLVRACLFGNGNLSTFIGHGVSTFFVRVGTGT